MASYVLQVSYDVNQQRDTTRLCSELEFHAREMCNATDMYMDFEHDNTSLKGIITLTFGTLPHLHQFLPFVHSSNKQFHVECIYEDKTTPDILFASRFFLTHLMDKKSAKAYKKQQQQH